MNIIENLILGLLCCIISILIYIVNTKIEKKEINNSNLVKISILGFVLGSFSHYVSNSFINQTGGDNLLLDQDIHVGQPDF